MNGVGEEHSGEPEGGEAFCHLWNLERPVGTGEREEEGAGGVSVRWGAVRWVAAVPGVGGGGLVGERATGGETSRSHWYCNNSVIMSTRAYAREKNFKGNHTSFVIYILHFELAHVKLTPTYKVRYS